MGCGDCLSGEVILLVRGGLETGNGGGVFVCNLGSQLTILEIRSGLLSTFHPSISTCAFEAIRDVMVKSKGRPIDVVRPVFFCFPVVCFMIWVTRRENNGTITNGGCTYTHRYL